MSAPVTLEVELPLPDHARWHRFRVFAHGTKAPGEVAIDARKIVGKDGGDRLSPSDWVEDLLIHEVGSQGTRDAVQNLPV